MHVIADFLFGGESNPCGIFLFAQEERLAGLDVYSLAGDAPKTLPTPDILRAISNTTTNT